jgi:hypothetical protein
MQMVNVAVLKHPGRLFVAMAMSLVNGSSYSHAWCSTRSDSLTGCI